MSRRTVAVVGSGSAGLAAAFRLHEAGYRVRLFESNDYVGGRMKTLRRDGFLIELGGYWIPDGYKALIRLMHDVGVADRLMPSQTAFAFLRDGRLHDFDSGRMVRSGLQFGLLSARSKLSLAKVVKDCHMVRKQVAGGDLSALADWDIESAAAYTLRRADRDVLDYIVNPVLACVAGDVPDRLSSVDLLYSFATFLSGRKVYAFQDGMSVFASAIADRLDVELGAQVTGVADTGSEVQLTWRSARGDEQQERFDGCVLAVPPPATAQIYLGLDDARATFLRGVTGVSAVNLKVATRSVPRHSKATFISIPDVEEPGLMLIGLGHNLSPGRAPSGNGLISIYTTPVLAEELRGASDEVCTERITSVVESVLPGLIDDVEFTHVQRWDPILLVSRPGYYRALRRFNEIARTADTRVQLAGDYFSVSSLNTACVSGERAATALRRVLELGLRSIGLGRAAKRHLVRTRQ